MFVLVTVVSLIISGCHAASVICIFLILPCSRSRITGSIVMILFSLALHCDVEMLLEIAAVNFFGKE